MNIAIIETCLRSKNPIDAHVRNSLHLQKVLKTHHKCDLIFSNDVILFKKYDVIIFSYASFYFDFTKIKKLIEHQDSDCVFGWITNEYNLSPNSYFKNLISFAITGFPVDTKRISKNQIGLNLNTWLLSNKTTQKRKKHDLIYYGTFRVNREIYFKKYLNSKEIYLSTSAKNQLKFKNIGCDPIFIDKMNWTSGKETLSLFKASLYIEDDFSNKNFTNLANRFYEALYCDAATFFDKSCKSTIEKSKAKIDEFFIIDSTDEIIEKLKSKEFDQKSISQINENYAIAQKEKIESEKIIIDFVNSLKACNE